jgi:RHS repeat-associated protein
VNPSTAPTTKAPWILGISALVLASSITSWMVFHREPPVAPVGSSVMGKSKPQRVAPDLQSNAVTPITFTPEQLAATANAKPCDFTVLTNLDLSRPPTESELIAAGNLGEKLTPTRSADSSLLVDPAARRHQEVDNLNFGTAIQAWNDHRYDEALRLFTEHLQAFPKSPWAAESMLHIGCHHQYTARFSESVEWFDRILAAAPKDTEMYHKAKLRRSIINVDLGKLDAATAGFTEMINDDPNSKHQSYASYWLIQLELLKKNETALRDCGQKALSQAAKILGNQLESDKLFQLTAAGPHGFTATELHATALQHGLESYPVRADTALDALPTPFIAHYKDRHYVTVESVTKDTVKLYDSRISASTEMPRISFEKNWSGFALLMKAAPVNDKIHIADHLDEIIGGCCGQPTQPADLGDDECDKSCGLPTYSVNPINMNFKVKDTPMWWDAPVGPSVYMTQLFNSQDSLNNYAPFGEKWSFEYASYLLITPGERIQVKDGDGKLETFSAPIGGVPTSIPPSGVVYQSPPGDFRVLRQTASQTFVLTKQDGTEYQYGIPAAMTGNTSVPLLLKIKDRHDNFLTVVHNRNGAITDITHSALPGKSWFLIYDNINGHSRVKRIHDPFGRFCQFKYDSQGRLIGQTDMGYLAYGYSYTVRNATDTTMAVANVAGGIVTAQLFIKSITTPSGTTTVLTEPSDGIDARSIPYTAEEIAMGYEGVTPQSYPPPGKPMWTNYRITTRDHLNAPTEYYFNGYNSQRYIRDPLQMQRPYGSIRPSQGARVQLDSLLVGGKGEIYATTIYDKTNAVLSTSSSRNYNVNTRLPSYVPSGNGGKHYLEYSPQGKPSLIRLHDQSGEDQTINIDYTQPLGIDADTVKRKIKNADGTFTLKTLADYNYFPNRDIQSVTDVNGRVISYLWYPNGLPQQITDSVTRDVIKFSYDARLRPSTTSINGVVVSTTTYDSIGKGTLQGTLAPSGEYVSFEYDNLNRLTKELRSDNSFTAYQWACCYIEATRHGKMEGAVEKTLRRSVSFHDKRALPISTTETDGKVTNYAYDILGRLTHLTDPKGMVTQWVYNDAGQVKEKIYADGKKDQFTYNSYNSNGTGKIQTFTNRQNQVTTLSYDYDGQINYSFGQQSVRYEYDSWRRLSRQTQETGSSVTLGAYKFTYDLLGRATSIDGPWTDDTIEYSYNDAARSVTRTSPGNVLQTIVGDAYGRISSISNILGTFTNTYNGVGGPLIQTTQTEGNAGFNTAYTYHGDVFGRALATITSSKSGGIPVSKHTYGYDSLGQIKTWKREAPLANPIGVTKQYDTTIYYDSSDQLSSLVSQPLSGSSGVGTGYHYLYDPAGNIASKQVETSQAGASMTSYTHNSVNQLTGIGGSVGVKQVVVRGQTNEPATVKVKSSVASIWKDARLLEGNRFESDQDLAVGSNQLNIRAKDGSGNTSNYTYSLSLAAATAAVPSYDADGNLLTDGIRTFEWDASSRLIKIAWGAGSNKTTEYRYNALSQRSEQIEKTGTVETAHYYYLYEGSKLLYRYNGAATAANVDRLYVAQGEQRKNGGLWVLYYYNRDHLGSIREVMNINGTLAARYDYEPYGKRIVQYEASGYTCDLGFTGHITQQSAVSGQSEIVLTHYRAYDPNFGKWLSADPIGERGGLNLYGYVGNDPINYNDRIGLDRKIVGGIHIEIQINKWKCNDGKWVKDGSEIWGFGPDVNSGAEAIGAAVAGVIYYPGTIWHTDSSDQIENGTKTDPDSDMRALKKLREVQKKGMGYNNLVQNCRNFARGFEGYGRYGYGGKSQKPTTNPDGTLWIAPNP